MISQHKDSVCIYVQYFTKSNDRTLFTLHFADKTYGMYFYLSKGPEYFFHH